MVTVFTGARLIDPVTARVADDATLVVPGFVAAHVHVSDVNGDRPRAYTAMGTDSGPFPERFQGYFEHLEMEMMVEAGMTPAQVLRAATVDAARAMKVEGVGELKPGAWADFVALERNPLEDIRHTRRIAGVWIAGNAVAR